MKIYAQIEDVDQDGKKPFYKDRKFKVIAVYRVCSSGKRFLIRSEIFSGDVDFIWSFDKWTWIAHSKDQTLYLKNNEVEV